MGHQEVKGWGVCNLMPKKSISQLKKAAWKHFSCFIRQRDADWRGYVNCVTCGALKQWKEGDAGHFIAGRRNMILFDERNVHFQCKPCNGHFIGSAPKNVDERYRAYMKKRYGQKVIMELEKLNRVNRKFKASDLEEIINKYRMQ